MTLVGKLQKTIKWRGGHERGFYSTGWLSTKLLLTPARSRLLERKRLGLRFFHAANINSHDAQVAFFP
jgi:hypothetical protein